MLYQTLPQSSRFNAAKAEAAVKWIPAGSLSCWGGAGRKGSCSCGWPSYLRPCSLQGCSADWLHQVGPPAAAGTFSPCWLWLSSDYWRTDPLQTERTGRLDRMRPPAPSPTSGKGQQLKYRMQSGRGNKVNSFCCFVLTAQTDDSRSSHSSSESKQIWLTLSHLLSLVWFRTVLLSASQEKMWGNHLTNLNLY